MYAAAGVDFLALAKVRTRPCAALLAGAKGLVWSLHQQATDSAVQMMSWVSILKTASWPTAALPTFASTGGILTQRIET